MTVLSNEDLIEIRTLMSLGWNPKRIFEFRIANELRGARDWKIRTIYEACKRIRINQGSRTDMQVIKQMHNLTTITSNHLQESCPQYAINLAIIICYKRLKCDTNKIIIKKIIINL